MRQSEPKFPNIRVKLVGEHGNAFAIMGRVARAMKREGCTKEQIQEYWNDAKSGDYNHLLQVSMKTVECY